MLGGGLDPAVAQRELGELHVRPRRRLRSAARGVERELHRRDSAGTVACQLPRVRDAGVRREARPDGDHAVERREGLPVATELDERVADHAVWPRGERREAAGLSSERERATEVVTDEREVAEPERRGGVARPRVECGAKRLLREGKERWVPRLAPAKLVGEAEVTETVRVAWVSLDRALELRDRRRGAAAGREPRQRRLRVEPWDTARRSATGAELCENAAEQAADAERGCGDARHEQCGRASHRCLRGIALAVS